MPSEFDFEQIDRIVSERRAAVMERRHFLRGLGVTIAIPTLESLPSGLLEAREARHPKRLVCIGNHLGFWPSGFFPATGGENYEMSTTLKTIEDHRRDFSVFSNLDHGISGGHGAVHNFLSGVKKTEASGFGAKNMTLDQAAAEFAGSSARYPSIVAGLGEGTSMCWTRSGVRIPPVNNPATLFKALFVDSDRKTIESERLRLMHHSSVLDALRESASSFARDLNAADRDKLDQYLTSVREVERNLQMSKEWLDRPKPKSPVRAVVDQERQQIEEMPLMLELLALALQTDSTRVASFEIPLAFRTSELDVGSYHGLSHHGKAEGRLAELMIVEAYFFKQFGIFLDRLKAAGVFDRTMVIVGSGMGNAHSHSNKCLPILLAGAGIRHRGHVICPENEHERVPLSNLWLSALQWFGLEIDRFGKSTGTFSPMELV